MADPPWWGGGGDRTEMGSLVQTVTISGPLGSMEAGFFPGPSHIR